MKTLTTLLALTLLAASLPAAVLKEFTLPAGSNPVMPTVGFDGNIWFTSSSRDKISRITPAGTITEFPTSANCGPWGLTLGPDRALWYTCTYASKIGRLDATFFPVEYTVVRRPAGPISAGFDGNLWFSTTNGIGYLYVINIQGNFIREFRVDGDFYGVTEGRGAMWATIRPAVGAIADLTRVTYSATNSETSMYSTSEDPRDAHLIAGCPGLGGFWFTEPSKNKIAFVPALSGGITEYPLPTANGRPQGIACAADGSAWYTLGSAVTGGVNKVGRRKPDGTFEEFDLPTPLANAFGIVIAPNGDIWFTQNNVHKIGRISPRPTGDANGDGQVTVADVFYLVNFLFAAGVEPIP